MLLRCRVQLPPPANWEDFEDLCRDLFAAVWADQDTQKHGRRGQPQHGVDVYGRLDRADQWVGVQCKGKDLYTQKRLTKTELRREVKKARKFTPPLSRLIMATTAPRDQPIQEEARQITKEHHATGVFSVAVWSWEDIVDHLHDHPVVMRKYYGVAYDPNATANTAPVSLAPASGAAPVSGQGQVDASTREGRIALAPAASTEGVVTMRAAEFHPVLDISAELLRSFRPAEALTLLDGLRTQVWHTADATVRFRLLANIGAAKLALGEEESGARLFVEALQYGPQEEKALANAALGYLLLGDSHRARTYAQQAIEKNPANGMAYAVLLQSDDSSTLDEAVAKTPEYLRDSPDVAWVIGSRLTDEGRFGEARSWLQRAADHDPHGDPRLRCALAQVILREVTGPRTPLLDHGLDPSTKDALNSALSLLDRAWETFTRSGQQRLNADCVYNRGISKRLLGDTRGAVTDLDEALRLRPSDPTFLFNRAILAEELGETQVALDMLGKLHGTDALPSASLFLAEVLLSHGRPKDAVRTIDELLARDLPVDIHQVGEGIRIRAYIELKDQSKAEELSDALLQAEPSSVPNLVSAARVAQAGGDAADSHSLLRDAANAVDDGTPLVDLVELANMLYRADLFAEAAGVYQRVADPEVDGPLTRRLIHSLFYAGEMGMTLDICRSLRQRYGPLEEITEIECYIHDFVGDLPTARKVCEEYLASYPHDLSMRVRLALIDGRRGDLAAVDAFLESDPDVLQLHCHMALQVVGLYTSRGYHQRALQLAYELRRLHYKEPDAHLEYVQTCIIAERSQPDSITAETVCVDTAVSIQVASGESQWFVVEDRGDPDLNARELALDHPLAQRLLGKRVGEMVTVRDGFLGEETGVIEAVQSKYIRAFQDTTESFQTLFPGTPGLWAGRIRNTAPTEGDTSTIQPLLDQVSKQHEKALQLDRLYTDRGITVGAMGKLGGVSVLHVLARLIADGGPGLWCTLGVPQDFEHARKLMAFAGRKLVWDPTAILTLRWLGVADTVAQSLGEVVVAQTTVDLFQALVAEAQSEVGHGRLGIAKENDHFVRIEVTPEQARQHLEAMEALLDWVTKNCTVLPCRAVLEINSTYKQQLDDLFGAAFIDTVLMAGEPGYVLFTDDERLRVLARSEFDVEGVWTQAVLMHLRAQGEVDDQVYANAVADMVAINYRYISIDASVLLAAAEKASWMPQPPFDKALPALRSAACHEAQALNVAGEFLWRLWHKPAVAEQQRTVLSNKLLGVVVAGRDRVKMLTELMAQFDQRSPLWTPARDRLHRFVRIWLATNITG